ncbi:MAG: hypothetical protein V4604_13710 [Bacteroidota bacterium]
MIRLKTKWPYAICNRNVLTTYYIGNGKGREVEIVETIQRIIDDNEPHKAYIGVTHHPCGRFTGYYWPEKPLPLGAQMQYNYDKDEYLAEDAHGLFYKTMFLVCYLHDLEALNALEIQTIAEIRKTRVGRLNNSDDGGGYATKSDVYFLYICISNMLES